MVLLATLVALASIVGCGPKAQDGGALAGGSGNGQPGTPDDLAWPRTFTKDGSTVVMYQPQVDAWKDHRTIKFRSAIAVTPSGASEPTYGVVAVQADTAVNSEKSTVVMTNLQPAVYFPTLSGPQAAPLQALVLELLPTRPSIELWLTQVLSSMHDAPKPRTVDVSMQPPPIYHSDSPAIMLIFMGQPQFKPVSGTQLSMAVNTNWALFRDNVTSQCYLLDGNSWLTAPDPLNGPWTAAGQLPADFSNLPSEGFADVQANVPGQPFAVVPRVYASTSPAELIVTQGAPSYTAIPGTRLMYVSNPPMPLFFDLSNNTLYYLVAGRWFSAPNLQGPWVAASQSLPAEFARIPESSPMSFVLASVPGTQEASDAVLLAQVPHKATINIADASVNVAYTGPPQFQPIAGTSMQYAANTSYEVVSANGQYYCCYRGVWFVAPTATGPWAVCTSVPSVIYTIPPSCPLYNVTYVQVYDATPTTVVVGYTGGYSGEYVAATGALMFGAGMLTGAILASNDCWSCCSPCYFSYGCGAWYHGGYCGYAASGSWYGPHASGTWGASYNPSTGTYSRSAYGSGAYGSGSIHQAYNPWSGGYGSHATASNGYGSWGGTTMSEGGKWAQGEHYTNNATGVTRGAADNSSGQWVEGAKGPGNNSVAKASNGDVYAGHDGNVYRSNDGTWQKYNGSSGWQDTPTQKPTTSGAYSRPANTQSWQSPASEAQNNWKGDWNAKSAGANWQNSMNQRPSSGGWQDNWNHSDVQSGLNSDSWARNSGGWGGGGNRSWGDDDRSWGGGGRSWGGGGARFGGFRR